MGNPFSLGIASGSPTPDGFVLWTRLAPDPLSQDPDAPGGMTGDDCAIRYEIATDDAMNGIVRCGSAVAEKAFAFSVHVQINGLEPGRTYFYRFLSGTDDSRIGCARTLPARSADTAQIRFGVVSCSNFEHGFFSAYRHLADESPDFTLFLGDFIYEFIETFYPIVRHHSDGVRATNLATYRNRHAQYRLDPDLQRLSAVSPTIATWDDHDVANNYANRWDQTFTDPMVFLRRRAAAYQAFYEHMPLRPIPVSPIGPSLRIYDRFSFGTLMDLLVLDGRQYRDKPACYRPPDQASGYRVSGSTCPILFNPTRTMLGYEQEVWLHDNLSASTAAWKAIGQAQLMARFGFGTGQVNPPMVSTDSWDGYPFTRHRLMDLIRDRGIENVVVLSGDLHSFWVNDLKRQFAATSPVLATEFVTGSISSTLFPGVYNASLPCNPHVRYFEDRYHGYLSVTLTRDLWTTRLRSVSNAMDPDATVSTLRTFVVRDGQTGASAA